MKKNNLLVIIFSLAISFSCFAEYKYIPLDEPESKVRDDSSTDAKYWAERGQKLYERITRILKEYDEVKKQGDEAFNDFISSTKQTLLDLNEEIIREQQRIEECKNSQCPSNSLEQHENRLAELLERKKSLQAILNSDNE